MSPLRSPPEPYLSVTDQNLELSIILEGGAVHANAMPSGLSEPVPKQKPKEKTERIPLRSQDYPSAANGASVQWKAKKVYGVAARLLKSFVGERFEVVPVAVSPEAGGGVGRAAAGAAGAAALSVDALRLVPSLSMADRVGAAVDEDARVVLGRIVAKLAEVGDEEEETADEVGNLDSADGGEGLGDAILVTMYDDCLEGGGTGYIELTAVVHDGKAEQDFEISHVGSRF